MRTCERAGVGDGRMRVRRQVWVVVACVWEGRCGW